MRSFSRHDQYNTNPNYDYFTFASTSFLFDWKFLNNMWPTKHVLNVQWRYLRYVHVNGYRDSKILSNERIYHMFINLLVCFCVLDFWARDYMLLFGWQCFGQSEKKISDFCGVDSNLMWKVSVLNFISVVLTLIGS